MEEIEKIAIIELLKNQSSSKEFNKRKEEFLQSEEGRLFWSKYAKAINSIELLYSRKMISDELKQFSLKSDAGEQGIINNGNAESMNTKSNNLIQYPIMILLMIIVSWIVFSVMKAPAEDSAVIDKHDEIEQTVEKEAIDNKIVTDEVKKGIDIMGLALNRSGFYILPYSVSSVKGVFGCIENMTNKLPLSIIWDDAEYGLAIANFPDKNFEKLASLPYQFSKSDYFLGEELFFVFSTRSGVKINKGFVIEDDADAYSMKVHLSLSTDVYGAVVLNNSGQIVGICDLPESDGTTTVIKSKAIFQIVKDMNLDKGITYVSIPTKNYLKTKSNAKRIETLKPFMSWYNTD